MDSDRIDQQYAEAAAANARVAAAGKAYEKATLDRALIFRALRRSGQSAYRMGQRLGLSTARVAQIVARGDKEAQK